MLTGIFLYILIFRVMGFRDNKPNIIKVSSVEAFDLLARDNTIMIIDIRTPEEFSRGHLEGAININYNAPDFNDTLKKLDKNNTYLIYCRTGNRSGILIAGLRKYGFKNVLHLHRGIIEWKNTGLPFESKTVL